MELDAARVKEEAAARGWVARESAFEPAVPVLSGVRRKQRNVLFRILRIERLGPFQKRPTTPGAMPPGAVDWHARGVVGSPGHQEDVSACVAYATCAMAEARMRIGGRAHTRLAPRYLHFCSMELDRTNGADLDLLAETVLGRGLAHATRGTDTLRAQSACAAIGSPSRTRVSACYKFSSAEDAKLEIAQHGPLVALMELREDFEKWYGGGIYRSTSAPSLGAHAVCLVGYDDAQACWIGMNSLGPKWGEGGFFRLAYGDSGLLSGQDPAYSLDLA